MIPLLGGLGGSLISNIVGGLVNNVLNDLMEKFGGDAVKGGIVNNFMDAIGSALKTVIASSPMIPEFLRQPLIDTIDKELENNKMDTTDEASTAVEDAFGDQMMKQAEEAVRTSLEEANEESAEGSDGKKGGGTNWLVAMMQALSKVAGQHLANSVELSEQISDLQSEAEAAKEAAGDGEIPSNADQAAKMTELQGMMQAETQMFRLAQEAATTIVKSVGEALVSTARKQ